MQTALRDHLLQLAFGCVCFTVAVSSAATASAADLALSGIADPETRWFEMFSDTFVELGKRESPGLNPDRFYLVFSGFPTEQEVADFDPHAFAPTYTPIGGDVNVFPNGDMFQLGTLSYDEAGLTGSGFEHALVSGYSVDFATSIADDDALVSTAYATTVDSATGQLTFYNGTLIDLSLSAALTFTYDFSAFGAGGLDYSGTFTIAGDEFTLFVDGIHLVPGNTPLRYIWDSTGTVDQIEKLPGDYTGDLAVDGVDFLAWQRQFGANVTPGTFEGADGNGDGAIDGADLSIWHDNFGLAAPTGSLAVAVPEPTAELLAGMALAAIAGLTARRTRSKPQQCLSLSMNSGLRSSTPTEE